MFRKYGVLSLGILLVIIVAGISLIVPGALVKYEGRRELGKVRDPGQLYYADNVSAEGSVDFNTVMRLMMKENRWESEKRAIDPEQADGNLLSREQARDFCVNTLRFFTWDMWQHTYQHAGVNYTDYDISDQQRLYLQTIISEMEEGEAGSETPYIVQELLSMGEIQLYKYVETVFNTYYFYVWEYKVDNLPYGIDVTIEIDAVTLDVYNISIGGDLFAGLPWHEMMEYCITYLPEFSNVSWTEYFEIDSSVNEYNLKLFLPLLWIGSYWNYWNIGLNEDTISSETETDLTGIMDLGTSERGYVFYDNGFVLYQRPTIKGGYGSTVLSLADDNHNEIFCGMDKNENGFHWYMATSVKQFDS